MQKVSITPIRHAICTQHCSGLRYVLAQITLFATCETRHGHLHAQLLWTHRVPQFNQMHKRASKRHACNMLLLLCSRNHQSLLLGAVRHEVVLTTGNKSTKSFLCFS